MEKKHMHVRHSRVFNSRYLSNCRGSERSFHLCVILLFGVFCICLLIGLLIVNNQYKYDKGRLSKDLEEFAKTTSKLKKETAELESALNLANNKGDNKCISNEELQKNLTDRLHACDAALLNRTEEMKRQIVLLREQNTEGSGQSLSEQNTSECILNKENELSTLSDNLTACLEDRDEKLSFMSQEKALLNTKVRKTREELLRLCHLFENASCPAMWLRVNCSCYGIFGAGTWDEARKDCISKGGDLLVLEDEGEQNRLYEIELHSGFEAWIGLTDRETEGSWQWLDGTSTTSKLSETYQPDGDSKLEEKDCAQIRKDDDGWVWNDRSCHDSNVWICEKIPTLL